MSLGNVERSLGILFITCSLNFYFLGCVFCHTFQYYSRWEKDHIALKIFVLVIVLVDTGGSLSLIMSIWDYLIRHFGDLSHAQIANAFIIGGPAVVGATSFLPQLFLIFRVWLYSPFKWSVLLLLTISTASLVCSILASSSLRIRPEFSRFQESTVMITAWLSTAAAVDVLITVLLLHAFRSRKTGFSKDEMMLDKFIRLAFTTGGATALSSLICLALFLAPPAPKIGLFFILPSWLTSKLYVLSVLLVLLNRPKAEIFVLSDYKSPRFSTATEVNVRMSTISDQIGLGEDFNRKKPTFKNSLLKKSFRLKFNSMIRPQVNSVHINHSIEERVDEIDGFEGTQFQQPKRARRERKESSGTIVWQPAEEKVEEVRTEVRSLESVSVKDRGY